MTCYNIWHWTVNTVIKKCGWEVGRQHFMQTTVYAPNTINNGMSCLMELSLK